MVAETDAAESYEPIGDPDHVGYGADFYWACTCGDTSRFITTREKARHSAEHHEQYCMDDGDVLVKVTGE